MRIVLPAAIWLAVALAGPTQARADALTLEQRSRLSRYLPRTFPKLESHDPIHVVGLGDSVLAGYTPVPTAWESNNPLFTYPGVFLAALAREFFYPGSVRLMNPPPGGTSKLTEYFGDEISYESVTSPQATVLDGLQRARSDAFLHDPDLVLVQFGTYDAFAKVSVSAYKKTLTEIVSEAQARKADVIVFSPTLVNFGGGSMAWGASRPYAMAAAEVAAESGVMYIDLGQHLSRFGGGANTDTHPVAAMDIIGSRLSRIFHYGPELDRQERLHPSLRASQLLGHQIFEEIKNGPPVSRVSVAGAATHLPEGQVQVNLALRNQSSSKFEGTIGALSVGRSLEPIETAKRLEIPVGEVAQISFVYQRAALGSTAEGEVIHDPLDIAESVSRFSFVLEDTVASQLVDLSLRVGPVAPAWASETSLNVTNRLRVEWALANSTDRLLSGKFQTGLGGGATRAQIGQPTPFSVSPLGVKNVFSAFEFDPQQSAQQIQEQVWLKLDAEDRQARFDRRLEVTRDLVLGEEMQMRQLLPYVNRADDSSRARCSLRFDADAEALFVVVRLSGVSLPSLGTEAALRATLTIDARSQDFVRRFGAVSPIRIYARSEDGSGLTESLPLGCFGDGYNMVLDPGGVKSVLRTDESGDRLLEIRLPRAYFHEHEWQLDSVESMLGVKVEIAVAVPGVPPSDRFPPDNRWVTHEPAIWSDSKRLRGINQRDARGLTTLRLTRTPVRNWSMRVF
ncbi:MAG: SGNH/GDSL hydrolase family protein [Verrucomicrobiota bacterium]